MKKVTLLLLALALVATTSVFATGAQQPAATARPILEYTTLFYFDGGDATENLDLKEEFIPWFNDYFNVDLRLNFLPRPDYPELISIRLAAREISGIIRHFGGAHAQELFADGSTIDWLPLIKDNPNWLKLEEGMRNGEWMRDGKLIGMPSQYAPGNNFVRHIRKDWLDNLGLPVPKTIEEFYAVMKAFTENDPNRSGKNDTVGMTTRTTWLMQDMFHAFGVPLNHVGAHAIVTDPHDGMRFNDGMLKPAMVDALQNLADLYKNGYLDPEAFVITGGGPARERITTGYAGSIYDWVHHSWSWNVTVKRTNPKAEFVPIMGLTSKHATQDVNPGGMYGVGEPNVMVAWTQNAKEQANLLLDLFLGDEIAHWSGKFGVYEKYWEFGPNKEIVRLPWKWNDGVPAYAPGPGGIGSTGDINPHYALWQSGLIFQGNEAASTAWVETQRGIAALTAEGLASGLYFQYPNMDKEPRVDSYTSIAADIRRIFLETVTMATTGQMTPQQAIASYRQQMRAIGAQQMLDEANALIGKTSSTVHRY